MSSSLSSKRALITAGAQGIGLAISRALLRAGCDVFVTYLSSADEASALIQEAKAMGRQCGAMRSDLTITEQARAAVDAAASFLGGIDVLVNNAGSLVARRSIEAGDDEFWDTVLDLNVKSLVAVTRAAIPHLKTAASANGGGASIINMSSLAGRKGGHAGSLAYSTAKGAVLTFTRSLAAELGGAGIRVNAIAPGLILGTSFHSTHTSPESAAATVASLPLGRAGTPEDVARAVVFFTSEMNGFITGATLDVNGGAWSG